MAFLKPLIRNDGRNLCCNLQFIEFEIANQGQLRVFLDSRVNDIHRPSASTSCRSGIVVLLAEEFCLLGEELAIDRQLVG